MDTIGLDFIFREVFNVIVQLDLEFEMMLPVFIETPSSCPPSRQLIYHYEILKYSCEENLCYYLTLLLAGTKLLNFSG